MKLPNPLPPDQMTPQSAALSYAACWRSGWFGCGCGMGAKYLTILENVAYTIRPTNAVMRLQRTGGMHEQARSHPRAPRRAQDHADA